MNQSNKRLKNNSGIILPAVLWVLVILIALVTTIGRSSRITVALTKNSVGQLKSKAIAWGGFLYALNQIRLDTVDSKSSFEDNNAFCAIPTNPQVTSENLFRNKTLGEGSFEVSFDQLDSQSNTSTTYFGMVDEERKFNLNALTIQNYKVFSSLITILGVNPEIAETIALSAIDWMDADDAVSHTKFGAEDDYYMESSRPYHCKNLPFDSIEELLMVQGMTDEIYNRLKQYVTVYPKSGVLKINFETASAPVLQALARAYCGPHSNTTQADADALVDKIIQYRNGADGTIATPDDRPVEINSMPLIEKEKVILMIISQFRTTKSDHIRIRVKAKTTTGITSIVEGVVQRDNLAILSWRRH